MRPTGTWAFLASLALLATIASAHHTWGYKPSPPSPLCDYHSTSGIQSAISSGAEVVTYGEPCFCKETIPYSIEVPKFEKPKEEKLGTYGYAVDQPSTKHERYYQLPVKIQTPVIEHHPQCDNLCGKSYGVMFQHQEHRPAPKRLSYDYAVQKPVKVHEQRSKPSLSILIQEQEERIHPRYSPLPIAIQTPVQTESRRIRLDPLSGTVDRVLVPACELDGCPECNDITKKHSHQLPPLPPTYSVC